MLVQDLGYSLDDRDDNYLAANVNWAYLSNSMGQDPVTMMTIAAALALIILTGYLIIYNIFQLSILREIRFYGLLKTIGTTKKQLQKLVYRQVWKLCGVGIPIGAVLGYLGGQFLVPILAKGGTYAGESGFYFNFWILIFGGVFSLATVMISLSLIHI